MKGFCENCNKYVDVAVKETTETFNVKGVEVTTLIKKAYCNSCKEEIYVKEIEMENDKIIYDAYNAKIRK